MRRRKTTGGRRKGVGERRSRKIESMRTVGVGGRRRTK